VEQEVCKTAVAVRRNSSDAAVVLEVDVAVELQPVLNLGNGVWSTGEGVIHVVARLEMASFVGEFAATELGHFFDFRTFSLELFGNGADEIIDAAFKGLGV
jgi:hypothetical protein